MIEQGLLSHVEITRMFQYFWRPYGSRLMLNRGNVLVEVLNPKSLEISFTTKFFSTALLEEDVAKSAKVYSKFLSSGLKAVIKKSKGQNLGYFSNSKTSVFFSLALESKKAFWFFMQWRYVYYRSITKRNLRFKKKALPASYVFTLSDISGFIPTRVLDLYNYRQRLSISFLVRGFKANNLSLFKV